MASKNKRTVNGSKKSGKRRSKKSSSTPAPLPSPPSSFEPKIPSRIPVRIHQLDWIYGDVTMYLPPDASIHRLQREISEKVHCGAVAPSEISIYKEMPKSDTMYDNLENGKGMGKGLGGSIRGTDAGMAGVGFLVEGVGLRASRAEGGSVGSNALGMLAAVSKNRASTSVYVESQTAYHRCRDLNATIEAFFEIERDVRDELTRSVEIREKEARDIADNERRKRMGLTERELSVHKSTNDTGKSRKSKKGKTKEREQPIVAIVTHEDEDESELKNETSKEASRGGMLGSLTTFVVEDISHLPKGHNSGHPQPRQASTSCPPHIDIFYEIRQRHANNKEHAIYDSGLSQLPADRPHLPLTDPVHSNPWNRSLLPSPEAASILTSETGASPSKPLSLGSRPLALPNRSQRRADDLETNGHDAGIDLTSALIIYEPPGLRYVPVNVDGVTLTPPPIPEEPMKSTLPQPSTKKSMDDPSRSRRFHTAAYQIHDLVQKAPASQRTFMDPMQALKGQTRMVSKEYVIGSGHKADRARCTGSLLGTESTYPYQYRPGDPCPLKRRAWY